MEFIEEMQNIAKELKVVDIFYEMADSVEVEFDSLKAFVPLQSIFAGAIVGTFSVMCCMMTDWVRAKPMLALWGMASTVLATVCAYGFLMAIGLPFTTVLFITPFLLLGIGMDDTFLMLAVWRKTSINAPVEERVSQTYAEAAVSMTITSLTNVLSFLIGAISSFRVLNIFCVYSGISILFLYIYQITFFGGWLAIYGRLEKSNRHSVTGRKTITLPEAERQGRSKWYKLLCTGGDDSNDEFSDGKEGATNHAVMSFFRDTVAVGLSKTPVKICILILFLAYIAGAIYGLFYVEEGLTLKRMAPDFSYYVDYYDHRYKDFMDYPYRVPIVLAGHVDYSNKTVQEEIEKLLQRIEGHKFYAESIYTDSWLRKLLNFTEVANEYATVIDLSNETMFTKNLRGLLTGDDNRNALDVVFDEDGRVVASRFIVQMHNLTKLPDLKECMLFLRHVFENEFPQYNLTAFSPVFAFAELLIGATKVAIQTVGMAAVVMIVVALVLIPESKCALYVGLSLFSIEMGVLGYMTLWGVNLDAISVGCLVMCIGFSVDFSAHITHAFISSGETAGSPTERLQDAVEKAGLPILQGATSSILGVIAMLQIPAYPFLIFVKTVTLVMVFGAVHALLFLPIILEMTDGSGKKRRNAADKFGRGDALSDIVNIFAQRQTQICPMNDMSKTELSNSAPPAAAFGEIRPSGHVSFIDEDYDDCDDACLRTKISLANVNKLDEDGTSKEQSRSLLPASKSTRYNSGETCRSASSFDGSSSGLGTDEATSGKGSAHGGDDDVDSDAGSDELHAEPVVRMATDRPPVDVAHHS